VEFEGRTLMRTMFDTVADDYDLGTLAVSRRA
jgi:hypothetical protein